MNQNKLHIINSEIQRAVSEIIVYEMRNPKIAGIITVTKVDTTPDLEYSKIFVSIFVPNGDKQEVFNQILHSANYIRRELAHKVDIRQIPYLQFYLDDSIEIDAHMDEVIKQIKEKDKKEE